MKVKIKTQQESFVLQVDSKETVESLFEIIQAKTGQKVVSCKYGYPLQQLTSADPITKIRDGDQLQVSLETVAKQSEETTSDTSVVVREMKDDNSCLFRSVSFVCQGDAEQYPLLRQIVAETIGSQPLVYDEAFLGRPPREYQAWILQPNSWGGAIELAILSDHFQTELHSVDVSTLRMDQFGQGKGYPHKAFVIYSGIHYDAIAANPFPNNPQLDQTCFPVTDAWIDQQVLMVAKQWKQQRKFTDLARFTLRCGVCKKSLVGESDAQMHAQETGHLHFTEY